MLCADQPGFWQIYWQDPLARLHVGIHCLLRKKNFYHQVWNSHYYQRIMTRKQRTMKPVGFTCSTAYNVPVPALPTESGPRKTEVWLRRSQLQCISVRRKVLEIFPKFQGKQFQKQGELAASVCQMLSDSALRTGHSFGHFGFSGAPRTGHTGSTA